MKPLLAALIVILLTAPAYAQDLEKGSAQQNFDKAVKASDRGDFATASREFRLLAEQGYAPAQFNLGLMYENDGGDGVPRDNAEAVKWYRRAAEQGDDRAQYELGFMYAYASPNGMEGVMDESVYKVIELIGTSDESWEKAAAAAIERAAQSLRDLRIAEVVEQDVHIENGKVSSYRVKLSVSFKYEDGD